MASTPSTLSELAKEVASFVIKERNKNEPKEVLFSFALQWFRQSQKDDDCTEEELITLLKDTITMWGEDEYFKNPSKFLELLRSAAFVVEIPNLADGSYDTKALDTLVRAVEASEYGKFAPDIGGMVPVISDDEYRHRGKKTRTSRAAFNYLPGWWDLFQEVIKTAAREHKIKVLRILLCPSDVYLRFPADGDYED
jgi:hypothetical protein